MISSRYILRVSRSVHNSFKHIHIQSILNCSLVRVFLERLRTFCVVPRNTWKTTTGCELDGIYKCFILWDSTWHRAIMTAQVLRSYDPMRYYVNNVSEFDPAIVKAYQEKDSAKINVILQDGLKTDYDVYICVNKNWHAFILCAANKVEGPWQDMLSNDPFDIPALLMVSELELCFENEELGTYKIRSKMEPFENVEHKIKKSFYIGKYKDVNIKAFQFAALRAAPHRYNVLLDDCVEFAKEFCVQLLAYCGNYKDLEAKVNRNITEATATGLSAEQLSRRVRSSGLLANTFLGGSEVTSFLVSKGLGPAIAFILVYTVVVAIVVSYLTAYFMK
ncbi:hypothetical protein KP79_PYT07260 [Mizuhopecten yessoensis]|uniref:Uncharacterized protein n=1 Tax=Mizuhopecten yessoensis TaxID=6573 RepID=A0A210QAV7_MIZYE|nr:hypothetical protein KP79_PYT07260 [Mizuhopecten yessoensis]